MHRPHETAESTGTSSDSSEAIDRNVLVRVLGPAADAVGAAVRRYPEYRLRNVERIAERAAAKCHSLDTGARVNLRVPKSKGEPTAGSGKSRYKSSGKCSDQGNGAIRILANTRDGPVTAYLARVFGGTE